MIQCRERSCSFDAVFDAVEEVAIFPSICNVKAGNGKRVACGRAINLRPLSLEVRQRFR